MSLLLPDYSSSSEDEAAPPTVTTARPAPAPAPAASNEPPLASGGGVEPTKSAKKKTTKKKSKKPKTTLFLPPEIQRLLESGTLGDSDDEDDDSLLARQKRAVAKRPRAKDENPVQPNDSLSFLPAPKHQLDEPKPAAPAPAVESSPVEGASDSAAASSETQDAEAAAAQAYDAAAYQQYYQHYDPQQYAQYYQQYQQQQEYYIPTEEEAEPSSKRARLRDRELERKLQMGQFDSVADKIIEVSAPVPDAWEAPPPDQLKKGNASDLRLKASFWNSSAGMAVASAKPSRLQRQKHQLNQLAFDAKAREFELLERKGAAIKTKRETHAKYGW